MNSLFFTVSRRTSAIPGWLFAFFIAGSALAGDEDISPSAYQQFDPVTGFTVTVDPDAENNQGHGNADGQADSVDDQAQAAADSPAEPPSYTWLYWLIVVVAGAGVLYWLRSKTPGSATG